MVRTYENGRSLKKKKAPRQIAVAVMRKRRSARRSRKGKGIFGNIGNAILPGLGGMVGGVADGLAGGLAGSLFGGRSAGINNSNVAVGRNVNSSHERGTEKLGTYRIPAGTPAGTIMTLNLLAGPTLGARLAAFTNLWDRVKLNQIYFTVNSSAPTTAPGNYIQAIDPDPVVPYASGSDLPGRMMALQSSVSANAWASTIVRMAKPSVLLYNFFDSENASDAEYRMYANGQYILATNTDFPDEVTLTVDIHWDVTFERPVLSNNLSSAPATVATLLGAISNGQGPQLYNVTSASSTTISQPAVRVPPSFAGFLVPPPGTYVPSSPIGTAVWINHGTTSRSTLVSVTINEDGTALYTIADAILPDTPTSIGYAPIEAIQVQTQSTPLVLKSRPQMYQVGFGLLHTLKNADHERNWCVDAFARQVKARRQRISQKLDDEEFELKMRDLRVSNADPAIFRVPALSTMPEKVSFLDASVPTRYWVPPVVHSELESDSD